MQSTSLCSKAFAFGAAALLVAGCRGSGGGGTSPGLPLIGLQRGVASIGPLHRSPLDKIKHIVIVIQENRTLNNLFYGFPGAKTVTFGHDSKNQKIDLKPIGLSTSWDLQHNEQGFILACNGTGKIPGTDCGMNGFDKLSWECSHPGQPRCPIKYPPYSYVPHSETKPYFDLAHQYVLADQMYPSNFDLSSYVSHQYIIAGQADHATNYPATNWGCPGGPTDFVQTLKANPPRVFGPNLKPICFYYKTVADELDAAGLSWHFYAGALGLHGHGKPCGENGDEPDSGSGSYQETGIWSSYQAIEDICYGADWDKDVTSGPPKFLEDVANGSLASVTWITPYCRDSDHTGCNADGGPSWVASIVNAIGESQFWNSTAIFVFWDDPGGFYDPVAPKYVDYDGLGMRIPMLIISPYAKKGLVSHVHYEHGSILRFIEDRFNLKSLAASDSRATSPEKFCFDFSKPPRAFVPVKSKYDISHFLHEAPDYRPADTN
jgi:phospholipase C